MAYRIIEDGMNPRSYSSAGVTPKVSAGVSATTGGMPYMGGPQSGAGGGTPYVWAAPSSSGTGDTGLLGQQQSLGQWVPATDVWSGAAQPAPNPQGSPPSGGIPLTPVVQGTQSDVGPGGGIFGYVYTDPTGKYFSQQRDSSIVPMDPSTVPHVLDGFRLVQAQSQAAQSRHFNQTIMAELAIAGGAAALGGGAAGAGAAGGGGGAFSTSAPAWYTSGIADGSIVPAGTVAGTMGVDTGASAIGGGAAAADPYGIDATINSFGAGVGGMTPGAGLGASSIPVGGLGTSAAMDAGFGGGGAAIDPLTGLPASAVQDTINSLGTAANTGLPDLGTGLPTTAGMPGTSMGNAAIDNYLTNSGVNLANSGGATVPGLGSANVIPGLNDAPILPGSTLPAGTPGTPGTTGAPPSGTAAPGSGAPSGSGTPPGSGGNNWSGFGSLAGGLAAIAYADKLTTPDMSTLQNAVNAYGSSNPNAYSLQAYNAAAGSSPAAYSQRAYNTSANANPTSALQSALSQAQVNSPLYIQAAQSPLLQSQAAGYGQMLQSQANRGIYGSSFGSNDIGNYMSNTNTGIANAGINAAQSAIGLQGQIGQNIGALTNQQNANLGNIGANIGSLTNQQNSTLGNIGGNMASATNQNLAGQTNAANDYVTQLVNAQANKTNLIGRALGGIGNGLNSSGGTIANTLGNLGDGLNTIYQNLFGSGG